ncbi:hypothetical protein JKF63_00164 [Porcisia hertigi]|uniref:Conserved oligomeric Golgi complex subunit 3 n=1 Tax=Porcisia hertigi TaxID=2761500 RepID=A0A836I7S7_9TRYP|nr:hypothetical protein JKF63_00164 [Porcisia hertigi]
MMAEQSATSGADEEALVMRQLELLLVPLHHRFCYPLAVPARFTASEGDGVVTGAAFKDLPGPNPAGAAVLTIADDSGERDEQLQNDRLHRSALKVVEEHVPELLTWQARVQRGAVQAGNCYQVLERVRSSVTAMQRVTESVQKQSDNLSHNASAMMVRKAKLELVRDALVQNVAHFTHIDDLCREAVNPFLKAGTVRFSALLQDIGKEMEFLSANAQYKSAKQYAMRLAEAQQTVTAMLKDAVRASFRTMELATLASPAFEAATQIFQKRQTNPGGSSTLEASASVQLLSTSATSASPEKMGSAPLLQLRPHDVSGSFAEFLASVNDAFVKSGESFTPLRRMVELRQGGFSYTGAEAFGEEMVTAGGGLDADPGMREVMDSYRDARVGLLVPLLRYWLTLWYYLDAQQSSCTDATTTGSVAAASAAVEGKPATDTAARQQLSGVAEAHTLPQLAEHICVLLQRCLALESDVLTRLWLREDIVSHLLAKLVPSIAEEVYYVFRSRLLCIDDVGELSRTVESIQRVSLLESTGVQDLQALSDLWVRMIQDTQERLVFRTSVYLRQAVSSCTPTREIANIYIRCGTDAYSAKLSPPREEAAQTQMFYLAGVINALQLLHWLYPTLDFSVFSVFAEEAVHHSLDLVRQLVKFMLQIDSRDTLRDSRAFLCQLAHLQYLQKNLSHVDGNITVVEKYISLAALRKRRLELGQSSRDLKREVEMDLVKCSEHLTTAMLALVTQPLAGAANKDAEERIQLVSQMKGRAAGMERMIAFYVEHGETRRDLVNLLHERVAELAAEVNVDVHAVPAGPVEVTSSGACAASSPVEVMTPAPPAVAAESSTENAPPLSTTDTGKAASPSASGSQSARADASGPADHPYHAPLEPPAAEAATASTAAATHRAPSSPTQAPGVFSVSPIPPTERVTCASAPPVTAVYDQPPVCEHPDTSVCAHTTTQDDTDFI